MEYRDIMQYLDSNLYLDARIKVLNCNFFGDEVVLIHEYKDGKDVKLSFLRCCKVLIQNDTDFERKDDMRNATYAQIPYFLQNIESNEGENGYYNIHIEANPLNLNIVCKKFDITLIKRIETLRLKCSEFK